MVAGIRGYPQQDNREWRETEIDWGRIVVFER